MGGGGETTRRHTVQAGPTPAPREVVGLIKIQHSAEDRGTDTTGLSKGKGVEQRLEDVRLGPPGAPGTLAST